MQLEAKIREWLDWLTVDKSHTTVQGYAIDLRALAKSVPRQAPGDYTLADLSGYLADRRRSGLSPAALKRSVSSFRSFFGFACGPAGNIAKGLPWPKVKRKRQRTLDEDQMLSVLAVCDSSSEVGTRDLALMCLMVDSGLRAREACRLKLADVDLKKRRLFVIVKGGDEKMGSFSASTGEFITRWLDVREKRVNAGEETLFIGLGGLKPGRPLTTNGLRVIFRKIGKRAGLESGFSPHDLRRTFATLATRRGAPSRVLMVAGRWENEAQLKSYTQDLNLHDFDQYSPVAGLLGTDEERGIEP